MDSHQVAMLTQEIAISIERGIENAVATIVNSTEFKTLLSRAPDPDERRTILLANLSASMISQSHSPAWCVDKAEQILELIEVRASNRKAKQPG